MDKYLEPSAAYERLKLEYQKYGSLIVAVDFDDTLFDFHKKGHTYHDIVELVRKLHKAKCYIIIWSGCMDNDLITSYCSQNDIPFDSINEEHPTTKSLLGNNIPRKVYANVYLDDRAGLLQVYNDLTELLKHI